MDSRKPNTNRPGYEPYCYHSYHQRREGVTLGWRNDDSTWWICPTHTCEKKDCQLYGPARETYCIDIARNDCPGGRVCNDIDPRLHVEPCYKFPLSDSNVIGETEAEDALSQSTSSVLEEPVCGVQSNARSKYWCFTVNTEIPEYERKLQALYSAGKLTYLVYGRERGSKTARMHLQGYLEFHGRLRFSQAKRLLGGTVHLERRMGSAHQASEYCKKEGDVIEMGTISKGQGARSDLEDLQADLRSGRSLTAIADDHFGSFLRYSRSINHARLLYSTPRNWVVNVVVYWGQTGTGKTRSVFDHVDSLENLYVHPGGPWFDGYDGNEVALFDDFTGSCFKIGYLLKLLDRYPMRVPVKGGFVNWAPKEIFITSNMDPNDWYPGALNEHRLALRRRISECKHFGKVGHGENPLRAFSINPDPK